MPVYTLNTTADALDAKMSGEMNEKVFKTYDEGQDIIAEEYEKNDKYVIVSKRYILPRNVLTEKTPFKKSGESGMDQSSKAYKNGIVYGAAAGLLTGLILRKKLLWFVLGGALVGGHISIEMSKAKKAKYEII